MAEILGSAVASESVSRIFSILSGNSREDGGAEDNAERLEFAVLKIHSVVAVAEDWRILHQPLLDWKARLKRVAEEGDGILRAHRRRSAERERDEGVARKAVPVHKRVTRAAARFLPFRRGKDDDGDPGEATVRRFERLAHVADEFFRYVQLGGRPKSLTVSMEVPAEPLLAGKTLEFSLRNGSRDALLLLHPCDGNGEVVLFLSCDDSAAWEKNVKLCVVFQLLERTDILDIVMSSLQLLPPQFGAACATAREFVREARAQETSYASASSMSMRLGRKHCKSCHPKWPTKELQLADGRLRGGVLAAQFAGCACGPEQASEIGMSYHSPSCARDVLPALPADWDGNTARAVTRSGRRRSFSLRTGGCVVVSSQLNVFVGGTRVFGAAADAAAVVPGAKLEGGNVVLGFSH
ncbi:hypothetical protein TRIUR3_20991 [Triticum urartu]|uniref:Uncharacterized protein n=1 Tax=Triticum urartu TaxID=4572 RepID=M7ZNY7_TRIUA|nr:hypothetical protein TRIUR3_20991 [Triticum urartu]